MIFFELFEKGLLGIMAAIIAYTQLRTANQELELHNQELSLNKQELMPFFVINIKDINSDSLTFNIINEGGKIRGFFVKWKFIKLLILVIRKKSV